MTHDERPSGGPTPTTPQGLAGGPGPSPPGVDDGLPKVAVEGEEGPSLAAPAGERTGGRAERGEEAAAARADPEEPDPS